MTSHSAHDRLIQRAIGAFQRGAWNEAATLCEQATSQFGEDANTCMMLGAIRVEAGDPAGGIAYLERARALMPGHVHVLANLGVAYKTVGRLQEARSMLEAALKLDNRLPVAHNNLGDVLFDLGDRAAAGQEYERALAIQPNYPEALAGLAWIAEEENRLDDARRLSEKALGLAPQNIPAFLTRARVALRDGDAAMASAAFMDLLRNGSPTAINRAIAEGYLGEACDRLDRTDDAFAAFSRANDILYARHAAEFENDDGPLAPETVRSLAEFVATADPSTWRPAPALAYPAPVFLIGFPRSGTTLLEQVLASHPRVTTSEERDSLVDASWELIRPDAGFERWAGLPDADIERLRSLYWQQVAIGLKGAPIRDVFVDKLPLNAIYLPLIHRLFPTARIILALRDPRDVALSCFQQRFGMNAAMFQMLRLDSIVAYYDAVMTLVDTCRAKLPLDLHVVKYESVVGDFDATVSALLTFLGLDWNDAVRDYATTASKRTIGTPSASQVVQPLYGTAQGKWLKYRRHLEPHLPVLERWVNAYGYRPSYQ